MKSGNGAPRISKIQQASTIKFGGTGIPSSGTGALPWVHGKGPGTTKPKKKK
jgi:hypothetical protein